MKNQVDKKSEIICKCMLKVWMIKQADNNCERLRYSLSFVRIIKVIHKRLEQ